MEDETLNRVLELLKSKHIPKGKFLADLGFDRSALSEWVRGKHRSYMKRLPEIAAYFDVSLDWLAGTEQKNKPSAETEGLSDMDKEALRLFRRLGERDRALAIAQLKAMLSVHEENAKK
jgi:transcriptional regulator with XRE-family HTH domain